MQAVPLGFYLFLVELAAGGVLVSVLLDWEGEVSPGFLLLNGVFLVAFAAAGVWLRVLLPAPALVPYPADAALMSLEPAVWGTFTGLAAGHLVWLKLDRRAAGRVFGLLAGLAGVVGLALSAGAYRPPDVPAPVVAGSFLAAALALGTVWSGMMLGHWYLVTPLLSTRPLLRLNAGLAAALIIQAGALALAAVAGAAGLARATATWPFWLRVGVGIAFPLALSVMVWRTARVRSMMSATGLLYVALGAVLAGEIIAKALLFIAQAPV
jgi:hypothetical protein